MDNLTDKQKLVNAYSLSIAETVEVKDLHHNNHKDIKGMFNLKQILIYILKSQYLCLQKKRELRDEVPEKFQKFWTNKWQTTATIYNIL